jgi:hypothetical protein
MLHGDSNPFFYEDDVGQSIKSVSNDESAIDEADITASRLPDVSVNNSVSLLNSGDDEKRRILR